MSVDWRGLSWPMPRDEVPLGRGRLMSRLRAEDPRRSGSLAWLLAVLRKPEPAAEPIPIGWKKDGEYTDALLKRAEDVLAVKP